MTSPEHYQRTSWRLIPHTVLDGPSNMAIDESIAEAVAGGLVPPTLRFYGWDPACLSLGYAQPISDVDFERLEAQGWQVVRRLTGGRAILHVDEWTYSVSTLLNDPRVDGGVVESYRRISQALVSGLERLAVPVHTQQAAQENHGFSGAVCFEVPSDYEVTAYGKKLLGSAQTRRSGVVLQHGALPLFGDITRICQALHFDSEDARTEAIERVGARAITLEQALGQPVRLEALNFAMGEGFRQVLNLDLVVGDLTTSEQTRADELREIKYASREWTERH